MARRPSPQTRPLTPREVSPALYRHIAHPHQPRNVNETRQAEQAERVTTSLFSRVNQAVAVWLTTRVGTMWCAYLFALIALLGFPGFHTTVVAYVQWASQTFIQLTMLSVIMVGQNVLNRHAEIQADEMFATTQHSFHDIGQMMRHLDAQDAELLRQSSEQQRQTDLMLRILASIAVANVSGVGQATTPADALAALAPALVDRATPDTHTDRPRSDAAATSPASPPAPAPGAEARAQRPAPLAATVPHGATPATSSASRPNARRGAPASGQRRRGYQTSGRS